MKQLKTLKKKVKGQLKYWKNTLSSRFQAFDVEDLVGAVKSVGLRENDILIAHTAYNEFSGFTGKPSGVLTALRQVVTTGGTIMMPSMPFSGTAVEYVQSGKEFDVRATPSKMGIVTELFRRSAGCLRSLHPTHPVLAQGPKAAHLLDNHEDSRTPCGEGSPFDCLLRNNGKILLLGTGIHVLTFYHMIEESLEAKMPFSPFTDEVFDVSFTGRDGEKKIIHIRLFDPDVSRRRDLSILEKALKSRRQWHEARVGGLSIVLLSSREVFDTVAQLAEKSVFCYV